MGDGGAGPRGSNEELRLAVAMEPIARPVRWIGTGLWVFDALLVALLIALVVSGELELSDGVFVIPLILFGLGWMFRYAADRLQFGRGPRLEEIGGWVFTLAGAAMVLGGIALVLDDPGGFALISFGAVFIGAGALVRRLFVIPRGANGIAVGPREAAARARERRAAAGRSPAAVFATRLDWKAGRVVAEGARTRALFGWAAALWLALALAAGAAAMLSDDGAGLFRSGAALGVAGFVVVIARRALARRGSHGDIFVMRETPARLGGLLNGEIRIRSAGSKGRRGTFQITLRCLRRRAGGPAKATDKDGEELWRDSKRLPARRCATGRGYAVPVAFALPADRPATTLEDAAQRIAWELAAAAAQPGIGDRVTFEVPVLDPEA